MLQPWNEAVLSGILGLCVGDALGVPVEFATREALSKNPVRGMLSGGTYDQPAGTWSDDTSMTLCQMDSITALREGGLGGPGGALRPLDERGVSDRPGRGI